MKQLKTNWFIFSLWLWKSFGFLLFVFWYRSIQRLGYILINIGLKMNGLASEWLWQHQVSQLPQVDRYSHGDLVDRY